MGKPLGIVRFSWLAVRFSLAELPSGLQMKHLAGAGFLAGIDFTMSLFIANLAFPGSVYLNSIKIGVLLASLVSGLLGSALLMTASPSQTANSWQHAQAISTAHVNDAGD